jgi:hypothetical protein
MFTHNGVARDRFGLPIVGVVVHVAAFVLDSGTPIATTTSNISTGAWSLTLESGEPNLVVYYLDGTYKGDEYPSGAEIVEEPV